MGYGRSFNFKIYVSIGPNSLVGYSSCSHKQSDMTEQLSTAQHNTCKKKKKKKKADCKRIDAFELWFGEDS